MRSSIEKLIIIVLLACYCNYLAAFFVAIESWYGMKGEASRCGATFYRYNKKYSKIYNSYILFDYKPKDTGGCDDGGPASAGGPVVAAASGTDCVTQDAAAAVRSALAYCVTCDNVVTQNATAASSSESMNCVTYKTA